MTVIGAGVSSQFGMVAESSYGTEAVVTRFLEYNKESITPDIAVINSRGLMAGASRFQRADRTTRLIRGYAGDIEFDVLNKGFGLMFQQLLGQDTITGATANKTHTCIPDALAQQGKSATIQIMKPSVDGTANVFTYIGGKGLKFELNCALDDILKLLTTWDFKTGDVNTTLASASYAATQEAFHFGEMAVTIGGTGFDASSLKIGYDPGLKADRRFASNVKKEPLAGGEAGITGEFGSEFESLTHYNSYLAGTQQAVVITFTSPTVIPTTAVPYSFKVTIPKVDFSAVEPQVDGMDILKPPIQWRGLYDGINAPITVEIVTSDATA